MVERGGRSLGCVFSVAGSTGAAPAASVQCVHPRLVGARGFDAAGGGGWCAISSERRDDSDGNLPSCQAVRASASALPARSLPSLAPSQSTAWLSLPPVRPLFGSLLPGASIER
jgi:hypothetical protein